MNPFLIADPDSASRNALALLLKHRFGVSQICEAGDVEMLIRSLADCQPGLLLLDWSLCGAPAPDACILLRKAYPTLKIVLLSADANDAEAAHMADVCFFHKGAEPDQLIIILSSLLEE
jgi:DNA-binding NarL/FixJ family response regulator